MRNGDSVRNSQANLAVAIRRIDNILREVHEERDKQTDVESIQKKIMKLKKDLMETERTVKLLLIELKKEKKLQDDVNQQLNSTLMRVKAYETETLLLQNLQNDIALISKNDFAELKSLMHPAKVLRDLFTAIAMLFKVPHYDEWSNVQKFIAASSTQGKIRRLKPEEVDKPTVEKVRKYIDEHKDTINRVAAYQANKKIAPLEPWLRVIVSLSEKMIMDSVTPDQASEKIAMMRRKSQLFTNKVQKLALTVARAEATELEVVNAIKVLIHEKKKKTGSRCSSPIGSPSVNSTVGTPSYFHEDLNIDYVTADQDDNKKSRNSTKLDTHKNGDDLHGGPNFKSSADSFENKEFKNENDNMREEENDEDYSTLERDSNVLDIGPGNLDRTLNEFDIAKLADEINLHAEDIDIDVDDLKLVDSKPRLSQQDTMDFEDSILRWNCYRRQSIRYKTEVFSLWQSKGASFKRPSAKKPARPKVNSEIGYESIGSDSDLAAPWLDKVQKMRTRRDECPDLLSPRTARLNSLSAISECSMSTLEHHAAMRSAQSAPNLLQNTEMKTKMLSDENSSALTPFN